MCIIRLTKNYRVEIILKDELQKGTQQNNYNKVVILRKISHAVCKG